METLTLDQANRIATAALGAARRDRLRPMSLVVLDEAGHVKLVTREDGATQLRTDIAQGKAAAAFGMGVNTRTLHERASGNPVFFNAIGPASGGKFIAQTGAVVIVAASGQVVGAIGASGGTGDEDEAICIEGLRAAGLAHR
ncbi:heme-binding protein [Paraburkholderia sp. Ac-20340]|uniref:GlcG/HbpS family heme-binding protein n=1 Tax=Paraburkholderia sp. Ac-20340 TaxID=2703888 RepID=UPI00197D613D|nr:heme-binding protein [Paraburkholderia sp. Ac-20340]MBN3854079.1 heme-binding protein [Paraburkholderia sp. Ac-20340]